MKKKPITPSEMGKKSWASRVKRHGKKKVLEMMKKASKKGNISKKKVIHI